MTQRTVRKNNAQTSGCAREASGFIPWSWSSPSQYVRQNCKPWLFSTIGLIYGMKSISAQCYKSQQHCWEWWHGRQKVHTMQCEKNSWYKKETQRQDFQNKTKGYTHTQRQDFWNKTKGYTHTQRQDFQNKTKGKGQGTKKTCCQEKKTCSWVYTLSQSFWWKVQPDKTHVDSFGEKLFLWKLYILREKPPSTQRAHW